MTQAQRDITKKLRVLSYAQQIGNVSKACRYFGVGRKSYYEWKKAYAEKGEAWLINSKPCPRNPALRTLPAIEEKVLHLRRTYHLGQTRISWYLERYHGIKISSSCVYLILVRHGMNRLPKNTKKRTVQTHRYEKQVPGHHVNKHAKMTPCRHQKMTPPNNRKEVRLDATRGMLAPDEPIGRRGNGERESVA